MAILFELKMMTKTQPLCYESYIRGFSLCERIYYMDFMYRTKLLCELKAMVNIINPVKQKVQRMGGG
jgi:hypothetical protein